MPFAPPPFVAPVISPTLYLCCYISPFSRLTVLLFILCSNRRHLVRRVVNSSPLSNRVGALHIDPFPEHFLRSNDKKLFAAVKKLLSDAEWETLCDSRVGVFCKFHDLKFEWSSKLVHTMLSYQLECKKKYEIWSAVADSPIRFSHEFEHLTGLNCDYVEDLGDPKCKVTLDMRAFWEKLGVGVELGPSQVELIRACEWATDWPK
ncbi:unnamed protein product [Microthlaspi erraticum]|uniref:DUF1985 domain-containing protein n=1 Tax=Microthlaspi erraticum TaxID=1685480 RepID=A0A6D2HIN4_9BRAS|nr:unnamed protein product [Microthlaspi erraticum]